MKEQFIKSFKGQIPKLNKIVIYIDCVLCKIYHKTITYLISMSTKDFSCLLAGKASQGRGSELSWKRH